MSIWPNWSCATPKVQSKFIPIRMRGVPFYKAAHHIASVIARSVLVKTGIYGQDPNRHGILAALGYALLDTPSPCQGVSIPEQTSVSFEGWAGYSEVPRLGGTTDY